MIVHNPFLDYDPMMDALMVNCILESSIILEDMTHGTDSQWYVKWKGNTVLTLKNSFAKFKDYSYRQNAKYGEWLKNNKEYFDTRKYPVKKGCSVPNAPDYKSAINRIKQPLTNVINGVDLNRIQIHENNGATNNQWFMKLLIPEYNGTGDDFFNFARMYYSGQGRKANISVQEMNNFVPLMYRYCNSYIQTITILENQMNILIT